MGRLRWPCATRRAVSGRDGTQRPRKAAGTLLSGLANGDVRANILILQPQTLSIFVPSWFVYGSEQVLTRVSQAERTLGLSSVDDAEKVWAATAAVPSEPKPEMAA